MGCPTAACWAPTALGGGSVGSRGRCFPAMGVTNRILNVYPETTKAMQSPLPNTPCWPSFPWICSSSFTGQTWDTYFGFQSYYWDEIETLLPCTNLPLCSSLQGCKPLFPVLDIAKLGASGWSLSEGNYYDSSAGGSHNYRHQRRPGRLQTLLVWQEG